MAQVAVPCCVFSQAEAEAAKAALCSYVGVEPQASRRRPYRAVWQLPLASWMSGPPSMSLRRRTSSEPGCTGADSSEAPAAVLEPSLSVRCESFCRTAEEAARRVDAVRAVLGEGTVNGTIVESEDLLEAAELLDGILEVLCPATAGKRAAAARALQLQRGASSASSEAATAVASESEI